ncbi:peroxidase-like [Penaeus chinensis]|uniref:peroxidase-like n=1 Tax=Penaeus chinensis TaxID=139456 RepID=UPI001FB7B007|nr:peroxidase-like [Penaeus chinensis]
MWLRVLSVALVLSGALVAGQIVFPENEDLSLAAAGGAAGGNPTGVINSQGPSVDGRLQGTANIFFPKSEEQQQILCITYKNEPGNCRLLAQCTTFFAEIAELSRSPCTINGEQQGVCCPPTKQATTDIGVLISKQPTPTNEPVPNLEVQQLNHACEMGISQITAKEAFEDELLKNNIVAEKGSPVALHAQLFQTTDKIVKKSKEAEMNVAASVNLVKQFNLTKSQGGFGLPRFGVQNTIIANTCPQEPLCPDTKYRAFDGTCNNRRNKEWGKAGTAFQRILPPDYHDGVNMPRQFSVTGSLLPSPRSISSRVIVDRDARYDNFTILIMQWGQFLDHDITHTPITKGKDKSDITCCKRGQRREPRELHPDCMPIEIPDTDTFFSQFGQRCMEFVRSMPAVRPKCNFGPREQMNQITSFIDASNVYGSTEEEAKPLRSFVDGKLKVKTQNGNDLLPPHREECTDASRQFHCFKAGDSRVNEQPELAVMHTVWMRQHNRIAEGLKKLNSGWDDEVLYQEARRIVAAQMQHITYNEYLPIVLGREFMEVFGLVPKESGYASNYRENIDPSINNAFATAAFRYGHTLIHGTMEGYSKFGTIDRNLRLSEHQFSPFVLYQRDGVDSLLRGLSIQASQKFDHFFSEELTNRLFAGRSPFGMDLVALNIQRGRDHGIPAYNQWRKICNLPLARDFNDLSDVMDPSVINQLRSLYLHVDDIDLFIGGIAEKPSAGSLLGHTFLCIVGDQFARLRLGDRFYYENGGLESSFSELQLQEIRKTTLSRIMCDNSNLDMMQPLAFVDAHLANKRAVCKFGTLIPEMSLEPWRNEPVWV